MSQTARFCGRGRMRAGVLTDRNIIEGNLPPTMAPTPMATTAYNPILPSLSLLMFPALVASLARREP